MSAEGKMIYSSANVIFPGHRGGVAATCVRLFCIVSNELSENQLCPPLFLT